MGNNTQTIKQRFLDILFEDDEAEQPVRKSKPKANDNKYKASDILYGKKEEPKVQPTKVEVKQEPKASVSSSNSAFINYDETAVKKEATVETRETNPVYDENYVAQPALSPIFGNIDKKQKKQEVPADVNYASVEKPGSSYLGTVLSPIYGYETNPNIKEEKKEEPAFEELKEVTDQDFDDVFPTNEYKKDEFEVEETQEIDLFSGLYTKDK